MQNFIVILIGTVGVPVVGLLLLAIIRPNTFRFSRSVSISAAPERIFPLINDLRAWEAWTPYRKDPKMQHAYGETTAGPGARYSWQGNRSVGSGSLEIIEISPPTRIVMQLTMVKPFSAQSRVEFTLEPDAEGTRVTWMMSGKQKYLIRLVGMFMDCKKYVTADWDKGLASLKALAENS